MNNTSTLGPAILRFLFIYISLLGNFDLTWIESTKVRLGVVYAWSTDYCCRGSSKPHRIDGLHRTILFRNCNPNKYLGVSVYPVAYCDQAIVASCTFIPPWSFARNSWTHTLCFR